MPGPWFRHHQHRRSLRARLAWAFVMVSVLTLLVGFAAVGASYWHGHNPYPWNFRVAFFALPVAAIAGVFTAGRITRRPSRLRHAVERLDLPDLTRRVPVEGEDEVAALAQSFTTLQGGPDPG